MPSASPSRDATQTRALPAVILPAVDYLDVLHYGLVSLVGLAAIATLWFAGYVVFRLYHD